METTIAGITAVESKDVNTSKGVGTLFLVKDSVGVEYSTFTKELAVQAVALIGQNATIGFDVKTTVKPNRDGVDTTYTNRYLKSLAAAGEQQERTFVSTPAATPPVAAPWLTEAPGDIAKVSTISERDTAIARAVALKAAVDAIVGGVAGNDDIISLAEYYRGWLQGEAPTVSTYRPVDEKNLQKVLAHEAVQDASLLANDDIPF